MIHSLCGRLVGRVSDVWVRSYASDEIARRTPVGQQALKVSHPGQTHLRIVLISTYRHAPFATQNLRRAAQYVSRRTRRKTTCSNNHPFFSHEAST